MKTSFIFLGCSQQANITLCLYTLMQLAAFNLYFKLQGVKFEKPQQKLMPWGKEQEH
jgi:hypothetical protein